MLRGLTKIVDGFDTLIREDFDSSDYTISLTIGSYIDPSEKLSPFVYLEINEGLTEVLSRKGAIFPDLLSGLSSLEAGPDPLTIRAAAAALEEGDPDLIFAYGDLRGEVRLYRGTYSVEFYNEGGSSVGGFDVTAIEDLNFLDAFPGAFPLPPIE